MRMGWKQGVLRLGWVGLSLLLLAQTMAQPVVVGMVLPSADGSGVLADALARAAEEGTIMAAEEQAFNAEMFGIEFEVEVAYANDPASAVAAAERLVDELGTFAVAGGFGPGVAEALAAWSAERRLPFLNIGSSDDVLRHEACQATTFHIEPSAAMYLDSLAGWYVRAGYRQWYVVHGDDPTGAAEHDRLAQSLRERHFGARIVGRVAVQDGGGDAGTVAAALRRANADLVVLLVSAEEQLRWLAELDAAGVRVEVAAFPHPEAQTRAFFEASRSAAPNLGTLHRGLAFEATLDAYGARELNARYRLRWDRPMDPSAWAAYQAVKILFEASFFTGTTDADAIVAHLTAPTTVFDVWKGIGTSFRPWDRQLRQSLYLVRISTTQDDPFTMGLLVGELPAIYMPGTDPLERLDQIGDLAAQSRCSP